MSKHLNASTTRFLSGAAWVGKELQELAITKIQRLIKVVTDPYHQTAKHKVGEFQLNVVQDW